MRGCMYVCVCACVLVCMHACGVNTDDSELSREENHFQDVDLHKYPPITVFTKERLLPPHTLLTSPHAYQVLRPHSLLLGWLMFT